MTLLQPGDHFRINTPRLHTAGVVTKINRVNVCYDSVYPAYNGPITQHLCASRWAFRRAVVMRDGVAWSLLEAP